MALIEQLTREKGYLDGRYMAATFNLLRGRDLIWNYVVNNYLMGEEHPPFDLLHWNGDTTNLPARWHRAYLTTSTATTSWRSRAASASLGDADRHRRRSRRRATSRPGARTISRRPKACGRSCTISPGRSSFVLAGSGHIAGVVNPPAAGKYQYWIDDRRAATLDRIRRRRDRAQGQLVARLDRVDPRVGGEAGTAKGARMPGKGKLAAIEDAPGRYVKTR